MTMKILSDFPASVQVQYRAENTPNELFTDKIAIEKESPTTIILSELQLSTQYEYVLWFSNGPQCEQTPAPPAKFYTQRYFDETFRFAIVADSHYEMPGMSVDLFKKVVSNLKQAAQSDLGCDFTIDIGDTFMGLPSNKVNDKSSPDLSDLEAAQVYREIFQIYSPLARSSPLFLVNGNHDGEIGERIPRTEKVDEQMTSFPITFAKLRKRYFLNPTPNSFYGGNTDVEFPTLGELGNYYAWNWGNTLIISLDIYWYFMPSSAKLVGTPWNWTLGNRQYIWLYDVLNSSGAKLMFVFAHTFPGWHGDESNADYFEWGGHDEDGTYVFPEKRPGWQYGPIHNILLKFGVSAVFRGHDHLFHDGVKDGIHYLTLPQPAIDHTILPPSPPEQLQQKAASKGYNFESVDFLSGHTEVTVSSLEAIVTIREADTNEVRHEIHIPTRM
jgi:hypothetical protein